MFTWAELLSTTGRLQLTVSHLLDHLPPLPSMVGPGDPILVRACAVVRS